MAKTKTKQRTRASVSIGKASLLVECDASALDIFLEKLERGARAFREILKEGKKKP